MSKWLIQYDTKSIDESDLTKCIYLSPDAEDTMDVFDESKIYIIGGLIDRNQQKNASKLKGDELKINC